MLNADISFEYRNGARIFSHLRFSVPEGGKLKIIAPPGSGKTTLAKILTGPVPSYSGGTLDGTVFWNGQDLLLLSTPERLPFIGRVSQNTDEMMLFSSIEEEIAFPLSNLGLPLPEINSRIDSVLSLFGLERFRGVSASELSGGEKRRLMLAVLFAIDPMIFVLDESFDELSADWRQRLVEFINKSKRTFIILGSHMLEEYGRIPGDVLTITDGSIAEYHEEERSSLFSFPLHISDEEIHVSNLSIKRQHKSIAEDSSFTLRVPSFSLKRGECVVLTGENGTGKSSFARVLSGLFQEDSGKVLLGGKLLSMKERRCNVAYLMQNPYEELFLPTVQDEAMSTGAGKREIEEAVSLFRLEPEWYSSEISYGKAKLLQAMLFYLLRRPFAVFDEFDSALPYIESLAAIKTYLEAGTGIIVITHDPVFASLLPGRRVYVKDGVLHEY